MKFNWNSGGSNPSSRLLIPIPSPKKVKTFTISYAFSSSLCLKDTMRNGGILILGVLILGVILRLVWVMEPPTILPSY